jgi:hypothetical protein
VHDEVPYERYEQRQAAKWLDQVVGELGWIHPTNEGKRSKRSGHQLVLQGLKSGIPDILVFARPPSGGSVGLAVELKRRRAPGVRPQVSREQMMWLQQLATLGWHCVVAYGWEAMADYMTKRLMYQTFGKPPVVPEGGGIEVIGETRSSRI